MAQGKCRATQSEFYPQTFRLAPSGDQSPTRCIVTGVVR